MMKEITADLVGKLETESRAGTKDGPAVTVAGDLNYDYIYRCPPLVQGKEVMIADYMKTIAGAAGYVSCGLATLGATVYFITRLGKDGDGNTLYREVRERGISTEGVRLLEDEHTPFTLIFADENEQTPRQVATYNGLLRDFSIHDDAYLPFLKKSACVYSCNYFIMPKLREDIPALFRKARAEGLTTAYDANAGDGWEEKEQLQLLENGIYPATDIVFLNEYEGSCLTGKSEPLEVLKNAAPGAKVVALKLGSEGALIRGEDRVIQIAAFPLPEPPKDTVGAGDSFQAAFLYFYLKQYPLEECGLLAAANSASTVRYTGGTPGQLDLSGLGRFLKDYSIQWSGSAITIKPT
jgi:sugar/nucleoside kinase (ribokinase family)